MARTTEISFENVKTYATEANLRKALAAKGLDRYSDFDRNGNEVVCRYMVVRTPDGRWTAVFLTTELLRLCGGYVGFAAQHGFMSV